jgi:hypothetical protein
MMLVFSVLPIWLFHPLPQEFPFNLGNDAFGCSPTRVGPPSLDLLNDIGDAAANGDTGLRFAV